MVKARYSYPKVQNGHITLSTDPSCDHPHH